MTLSKRIATKEDPIYKRGATITIMKKLTGSQKEELDPMTKVEESRHCLLQFNLQRSCILT